MNDMFMSIMKTLGVKDLFIEVDTINKQIFKFHKINGAKVVSTFTLLTAEKEQRWYMI